VEASSARGETMVLRPDVISGEDESHLPRRERREIEGRWGTSEARARSMSRERASERASVERRARGSDCGSAAPRLEEETRRARVRMFNPFHYITTALARSPIVVSVSTIVPVRTPHLDVVRASISGPAAVSASSLARATIVEASSRISSVVERSVRSRTETFVIVRWALSVTVKAIVRATGRWTIVSVVSAERVSAAASIVETTSEFFKSVSAAIPPLESRWSVV